MSLVINDRVRETTSVTGTGSATLLGAVTGYQSFSVIGNGNTTYYTIADQGGANWEVGIGTYSTSGPTLARTTVLSSSNSGALVNFTAGTKDVFVTQPSEKAAFTDASGYLEGGGSYNIALNGNLGFNSTGARITGDFSNATLANRVAFQTSTTNSTTTLTVIPNGTSTTAQLNLEGDPSIANGAVAQFINVGGSDVRITSAIRGTGTYLPLTMWTGGGERLRIDTSGNVGIGTNSPTSALVVSGAAQGVPTVNGVHIGTETGYATIELVGTSTTGSLIDFTQSGTDFKGRILYSNTDNHLELDVNGAEAMRITSAGYVGIAQAAPVTYLQVGTGVSNSANYIWAAGNSANPPSSATYGILLGSNLSQGTVESNLIWGQGISSSQYFNIGKWTGSAYTEQMRITSSGNVGIGTNNPSYPLVIASSSQPQLVLQPASTVGGQIVIFSNGASTNQFVIGQGYGTGTDNIAYVSNNATADMIFRTAAAERMRILSGGNVGIGTSAPTATLHVAKNSQSDNTNAAVFISDATTLTKGVSILYNATANNAQIQSVNKGVAYTPLLLNPEGSNVAVNISTNLNDAFTVGGNIASRATGPTGVGAVWAEVDTFWSTPTYQGAALVAYSASASQTIAGLSAANQNGLLFQNGAAYGFIYSNNAIDIIFAPQNTERMRIKNSGNVGIGTSAPAGKLHINTGTNQNAFFTNGTGYAGANGVAIASVNDANNAYQQFVIASSNFIVNASGGTGNMGIATNSPQSYLDIAVGSQSYNPTYTGHLRLPGTGNPAVTNTGGLEFIASSYASGFGFRIAASDETGGSTPLQFFVRANTATWTEGMRFTNAGSLLIGTTNNPTNGCLNLAKSAYIGTSYYNFTSTDFALTVAYGTTITQGISFGTNATSGTQTAARFIQNGSTVGTIQTTNTATAFNTSSDYRLKENVQPLTNALNKIVKLKPVIYKWKSDGSDGEGFIAHELAEICPLAVSGEKDAVDSDGNIKPQGIDTSKLVATLTAAIQEQQQLINNLTARIAKLEGK